MYSLVESSTIHTVVQPSPPSWMELSRAFRNFPTSQIVSLYISDNFPLPPPAAPGHHHSIFCVYECDTLGTSCEWDRAVFVLSGLAYFSQRDVFEVKPQCSMCYCKGCLFNQHDSGFSQALYSTRPQPWSPSLLGPHHLILASILQLTGLLSARILLSPFSKKPPTLDVSSWYFPSH